MMFSVSHRKKKIPTTQEVSYKVRFVIGWLWQNSGLCQTAGKRGTAWVYLSVCVCVHSLRVSTVMISSLHSRWQVWLSVSPPELKRRHSMHFLKNSSATSSPDFKSGEIPSYSSTQTPRMCVSLTTASNLCLVTYTLTISYYASLQRTTQKLIKINTCCSCRKIGFNANLTQCDKWAGNVSLLACFTFNTSEFSFVFRCVMHFLMYWPNRWITVELW